jgi:hypothetical protein
VGLHMTDAATLPPSPGYTDILPGFRCPLCGTDQRARKKRDADHYEVLAHGECGQFRLTAVERGRFELFGDAERRQRARDFVRAENAKGRTPDLCVR